MALNALPLTPKPLNRKPLNPQSPKPLNPQTEPSASGTSTHIGDSQVPISFPPFVSFACFWCARFAQTQVKAEEETPNPKPQTLNPEP